MAELTDASVDLIVTSPPYWVAPEDPLLAPALLRDGRGATPDSYEALLALLSRCFAEAWRVLRPGRVCAVNVASTLVGGRLHPLPQHLVGRMEALGWELKEELVWRRWRGWDKRGGVLIQHPYPGYWYPNRTHESIFVFRKPGGPPVYAGRTDQQREESRVPVNGLLFHEINNSVWSVLPVPPGRKTPHPCEFPEEIAWRLITLYSYKGDLVLDPFAGSGTTLKVARLLGRRWAGYETNPAFVRLAEQRVQETAIRRSRHVARYESYEPYAPAAPDAPGTGASHVNASSTNRGKASARAADPPTRSRP
jgi:DNA modification methylase